LTTKIVEMELKLHPGLPVVYRDLAATPVTHLSGPVFAARAGMAPEPEEFRADLLEGQAILDEYLAAMVVVLGAPMYNLTVPSQLKAWIDRIVVAGQTFKYTETGVEGLSLGKKIIVASSRGGNYGAETPMAFLDHQESYLKGVFGLLGISDVTFIRAEGLAMGPEHRDTALAKAGIDIAALATA
jgi:FMN-dependent NADH-azoreductase